MCVQIHLSADRSFNSLTLVSFLFHITLLLLLLWLRLRVLPVLLLVLLFCVGTPMHYMLSIYTPGCVHLFLVFHRKIWIHLFVIPYARYGTRDVFTLCLSIVLQQRTNKQLLILFSVFFTIAVTQNILSGFWLLLSSSSLSSSMPLLLSNFEVPVEQNSTTKQFIASQLCAAFWTFSLSLSSSPFKLIMLSTNVTALYK